jgi:hypothetical protein
LRHRALLAIFPLLRVLWLSFARFGSTLPLWARRDQCVWFMIAAHVCSYLRSTHIDMFTCSAYVTFPHEDVEVQLVEVWQRITCDGCKNSNYNILVNLEILDKYPALVLHYSGVLLLLRSCCCVLPAY